MRRLVKVLKRCVSPRSVQIWAASVVLFADWQPGYAATRFVDASATGANNGTTWADAYTSLQSGLTAAVAGDEIWVAAATYRPAAPGAPRTSAFQLKDGVALYGGFPVGGGTFAQRDPDVHVTTLSGDLNSNDGPNFANNAENAYHVVHAINITATTVLDGFQLTGGNANGTGVDGFGGGGRFADNDDAGQLVLSQCHFLANQGNFGGGGAYIQRGAVEVLDCRFEGNSIPGNDSGGGAFASTSGTLFQGCEFVDNFAGIRAGGLLITGANANSFVIDCLFEDNTAGWTGGGLYYGFPALSNLTFTVRGCTFRNNQALTAGSDGGGGGLWAKDSDLRVSNCDFIGNSSGYNGGGAALSHNNIGIVANCDFRGNSSTTARGGGLYHKTAGARVMGCQFVGNSAWLTGGGMILANCCPGNAEIINCTIAHNYAEQNGGGIDVGSSNVVLSNSIVWGNTDGSGSGEAAQITLPNPPLLCSYTIVQGWTGSFGGVGNNGSDPQFVDANGSDNLFGTDDDDLHLISGSPGIDSGNNSAIPSDLADVDGDANFAEPLPIDIAGLARRQDDPATTDTGNGTAPIVDRGAHEFGLPSNTITYTGPSGGSWFTPGNWSGGTIPDDKSTVVIPGSVQIATPGAVAADITIEDDGHITISSTGSLTAVSMAIESGGTLTLNSTSASLDVGSINVLAGGATQWSAGTIIINGGGWTQGTTLNVGCAGVALLDVRGNAAINVPAVQVCPLGTLVGHGTISGNLTNDGIVRPGDPTGQLTVSGTYLQTSTATLEMELGGYAAADYDSLAVAQQATLGGTLIVTLRPGFNHVIGGIHTLVTGNNIGSAFATINLPSLPDTAGFTYQSPSPNVRTLYAMVSQTGPRLYVNTGGSAGGNAQSWLTSVRSLQSAIDIVAAFPGQVQEIWVAEGTYVPDKGPPAASFHISFTLPQGVAVYGGFAGGETLVTQRDWQNNPTILSGDTLGDDGTNFANRVDNALTVVRIFGSHTASTILDGFIVRGGNATGAGPDINSGGGMDIVVGQPLIRHVTFEDNQASSDGGGVWTTGGGRFERCLFQNNRTLTGSGGGMHAFTSLFVRLTDCTFDSNLAASASVLTGHGGGLAISSAQPSSIVRCDFINNISNSTTGGGGGLWRDNAHVVNCAFYGNHAQRHGGAVYAVANAQSPIANCIFSGNTAALTGGGLYISGAAAQQVVQCTAASNHAQVSVGGIARATPGTSTLANCILWSNSDPGGVSEASQVSTSGVALTHCVVSEWTGDLGGAGNSGNDPSFVNPAGPDLTIGTLDDDLSLASGSPCIDAGHTPSLPQDLADIDGDSFTNEVLPLDFAGRVRAFDEPSVADTGVGPPPMVDIGSHEFGAPFGVPGTYIGPPGGSWFVATHWSGGQVPDASTDLIIEGHVVIALASAAARDIVVRNGGILEITDGSLTMRDLTVQGGSTLRLSDSDAVFTVHNLAMESGSALEWQAGTIHVLGEWSSAFAVNVGCLGAATLQLDAAAQLTVPSLSLCTLGALEGIGSVNCNVTNAGQVRPGLSPGLLTIDGNFVQSSTGTLIIEVDGFTSSAHDRISITGTATIDGTLQAVPNAGLIPIIGEIEFMTAQSITGTFPNIVSPPLANDFTLVAQIQATRARFVALPNTSRLYVKAASAPGPGVSWETATPDLGLALATVAQAGGAITEVWVAAGSYIPSERFFPTEPRSARLHLLNGVAIYGGFEGDEVLLSERDPESNLTIISGDRNGDDGPDFANRLDNIWQLVMADGVATSAVLDGFILRGGHAISNGPFSSDFHGGGLHAVSGSPTIRNCRFLDNFALRGGGGIYAHTGQLTLENCDFIGNAGTVCNGCGQDGLGGALLILNGANVTITDGAFEENAGLRGGAVYLEAGSSFSSSGCSFDGNKAWLSGGAIEARNSALSLDGCTFANAEMLIATNLVGGGLWLFRSSADISDSQFMDNTTWSAGAVHLNDTAGDVTFTNCDFTGNSAIGERGGAVVNDKGSPTFIDCTFTGNTSVHDGGAVASYHFNDNDNNPTFVNCDFVGNSVTAKESLGGALFAANGDATPAITDGPRLDGCTFTNNSSVGQGGAIYSSLASVTLIDCALNGNTAADDSSIFNENRGVIRGNPTLTGGDQLMSGGGIVPGSLPPAAPVATLTVSEAMHWIDRGAGSGDSPSLAVDIGGDVPGVDFDQIDVNGGHVDIAGRVVASTLGGFQPGMGDSFEIIRAATRNGAFALAYFPPMPSGLLMTVEYTATGVSLVVDEIGSSIAFADPSNLGLPGTPSAAALGDLDNDGDLDVALCIPSNPPGSAGAAYVVRNGGVDGQGNWLGFTSVSQPMATGTNPTGIAIGRFDSDAWMDIAIINGASNTISRFRNDASGNATFNAPQSISLSSSPTSVAAAPLSTTWDSALVTLASGHFAHVAFAADGTPGVPAVVATGLAPTCLVADDLDHDGDRDVVVLSNGTPARVNVHAANAGVFAAPETYDVGINALSLLARDFNSDGWNDVIASASTSGIGNAVFLVNPADSTLTLGAPASVPIGSSPQVLAALDVEPDGDLDLLALIDESGPVIRLARNDINGGQTATFSEFSDLVTGESTRLVLTGDINNDDIDDVISVTEGGGGLASQGSTAGLAVRLNIEPVPCPGDIVPPGGDGLVDVNDLLAVITTWGPCPPPPATCVGDNSPPGGNGMVDVNDLLGVITTWGVCP